MAGDFYESDRAVAEYLLFHYGSAEQVMPWSSGPLNAVNFAARCVSECLNAEGLPGNARALDLGCAVGRSTFELALHCAEVIGVDSSEKFIETARELLDQGSVHFSYVEEGELKIPGTARVPGGVERQRVRFERADAADLPKDLGEFDVVLMANLIDRLQDPKRCVKQLPGLVKPGGQLVLTSPYTWLTEYTPRRNWLGGFERGGKRIKTLDTLKALLGADFELVETKNLPFFIREHSRKHQWGMAEASLWRRKGGGESAPVPTPGE
jgi:putative 4-mercaptohistidine N1-methyltranferase